MEKVKEKYEAPEAEVISFEDSDIITDSDTRLPRMNFAPSIPRLPNLF